MAICGPKLSMCGIIFSIWGVIQLGLMGVFFFVEAVALSEDIIHPEEFDPKDPEKFYSVIEAGYRQNAFNCWIAALLYLVTLVFSAQQFWANSRSSLSV